MFRVSTLTLLLISLLLPARPAAAAGAFDLLKGCSLKGFRSALNLPPKQAPSARKEIPKPQVEQTKSKEPVAAIPVGPAPAKAPFTVIGDPAPAAKPNGGLSREQRKQAYAAKASAAAAGRDVSTESRPAVIENPAMLARLGADYQTPAVIAESQRIRGEVAAKQLESDAVPLGARDRELLMASHSRYRVSDNGGAAFIETNPENPLLTAQGEPLLSLVNELRQTPKAPGDAKINVRIALERPPSDAAALALHELCQERPDLDIVTAYKGARAKKLQPERSATSGKPDYQAEIQERLRAVDDIPELQRRLNDLRSDESFLKWAVNSSKATAELIEELRLVRVESRDIERRIGKIRGDELEAQVANFFPGDFEGMGDEIWPEELGARKNPLGEVDVTFNWAYVEVTSASRTTPGTKSKAEQVSNLMRVRKKGLLNPKKPVVLYAPNYLEFEDVKARLEAEGYRQGVDFFFARSREELAAIREKLLRNPTSDRGLLTR